MCNERFILFSTIFKQLVQTLNIPIAVECQVKQVMYTVMPLLSAKLAKTAPRIATTKLVMRNADECWARDFSEALKNPLDCL